MKGVAVWIAWTIMVALNAWALPEAYKPLALELQEEQMVFTELRGADFFASERPRFEAFDTAMAAVSETGRLLEGGDPAQRRERAAAYLKALRAAQAAAAPLLRRYAVTIDEAMERDDRVLFALLISHPLAPLENRHLQERVRAYYEPRASKWNLPQARKIVADLAFEEASRSAYAAEMQAYETAMKLAMEERATALKGEKRVLKSFRKMTLYSVATGTGYALYMHNANAYSVTSVVRFGVLQNLDLHGSRNVSLELESNGEALVGELVPSGHGKTQMEFSISMAMGWASARHDDSVDYRVPFTEGREVIVSQGFNGSVTHKGRSRYAVDFAVPEGTPICAARSGKVVATEQKYTEGAFDESYLSKANYVLIEHDDKTYSQYAHLRHNGVSVSVGDRVSAGTLIGYSGNTGYSRGPHLHFEVLKSVQQGKSAMQSIPFRFKTAREEVSNPKIGDRYVVVR